MTRHVIATMVACMMVAVGLRAEKAPSADPEKVKSDPQFAIQGEYVGQIKAGDNILSYGVQVIALGDDKYQAVAYPGGLPGDGWRKEEGKVRADSTLVDGVITFKDPETGSIGQIREGAMVVSDPNNPNVSGKLEKVIRKSPTLGARPPQGARVLFAGKDQNDFGADKVTEDGLLMQGVTSRSRHGSCSLHLEFMLPFEPKGRGQGRGNSGVYLQSRYEVQILDSFGLEGRNNEAGGIYEVSDPAVNMCFPPMSWQTYDIDFTAPQFDASGKKVKNARMTVRHNGVLVQQDVDVPGPTRAAPGREANEPGPLYIQDHGHPVRFRNIWIVEKN